jgi:hypothetical protein
MARKPPETLEPTQAGAARQLGITARGLRLWAAEAWFPKDAHTAGGWDVEKIKAARDAEDRKGSPVDADREARRRRKDDLDAAIKQQILAQETMKRQQLEGSLFPRAGCELVHSTILTSIGDRCDQLPELVGPLAGKGERKAIELELKRWGDELRESLEKQLNAALKEWDDLNK